MTAAGSVRPSRGRVLVTGGSRGIGRATALALAHGGATVVIVGRDEAALAEVSETAGKNHAPGVIHRLAVDLLDLEARRAIVPRAVGLVGGLDGCVQAAGVAMHQPATAIEEPALATQLGVNFIAPTIIARDFARHLKTEKRPGAMVLVGSTLAIRGAPSAAVYAATKAAIHSLGKSFAGELAPHGIRVNVVAPGIVETDMIAGRDEEALRALHPLGRLGQVDDVVPAILHLLDAPWVTGTVHVVDGGLLVG